jgi:putative sigma-54 modulation protein
MNIDIQALNFSMTDSIESYVKDRINYLFSSRYDQIQHINVRLSGDNGPMGGNDKHCQVRLTLPRLKEIVIDDVQSDLYVAIFRAMDRASRTLSRRLSGLQDRKSQLYVPYKLTSDNLISYQYNYP